MLKIDEEVEGLLKSTSELAKKTFENSENLKDFLLTLSRIYNVSYNNILLLKAQKEDVSFVADKEKLKKYGFNVKIGEKPLKVIKRQKVENETIFKLDEVYDISQTDAVKKEEKNTNKEYIDIMLKGMCARRGIEANEYNIMANIEKIVTNIKDNTKHSNLSKYNIREDERQTKAEISATVFAVAKNLKINTRNYFVGDICDWASDKKPQILKASLRNIQKFTNYFVTDFKTQEKLNNIENKKQEEEEME